MAEANRSTYGQAPALTLHPDVQVFFEYWKTLRGDELVPSLDTWLTHLTATVAMHKFRAELLGEDALVLFSGSALVARRGRNNTGESLYGMNPARRAPGVWNLRQLIAQPCGISFDIRYRTSAARVLTTHTMVLPLKVAPGRNPQIVGFSVETPERLAQEVMVAQEGRHTLEWIDVGAGTPLTPPR